MINKYASYDRVSGEKYGKRPVSVVCYITAKLCDDFSVFEISCCITCCIT